MAQYVAIYPDNNAVPALTLGPANDVSNIDMTLSNMTGSSPTVGPLSISAEYTSNPITVSGIGADHQALMFGGESNSTKELGTRNVLVRYSDVGAPEATFYKPIPSLDDMDPDVHYAFEQYASVEAFSDFDGNAPLAAYPTFGSYKMGEITYTFSRAVANPVLHLTGLGGRFTSSEYGTIIFSVRYRLKSDNGRSSSNGTLQRIDGTTRFIVDGDDIYNDFSQMDFEDPNSNAEGAEGDDAGTGSVVVLCDAVTSVTFEVFMDGKTPEVDGVSVNWTTVAGDDANQRYTGDRFNSSWSILEAAILPISLSSFLAVDGDGDCSSRLNWSTESEVNASHMEVELSVDGRDFNYLSSVGAKGRKADYSYFVPNASKYSFARLKLLDLDGTFSYSNIISINASCDSRFETLYPNPAKVDRLVHFVYRPSQSSTRFEIHNIHGQKIKEASFDTPTDLPQKFDLSLDGLEPGVYFLVSAGGEAQRFMVME